LWQGDPVVTTREMARLAEQVTCYGDIGGRPPTLVGGSEGCHGVDGECGRRKRLKFCVVFEESLAPLLRDNVRGLMAYAIVRRPTGRTHGTRLVFGSVMRNPSQAHHQGNTCTPTYT